MKKALLALLGFGLAAGSIILGTRKAKGAPAPDVVPGPPPDEVPLPPVEPPAAPAFGVAPSIERECDSGYMDGKQWVCLHYSESERTLHLTVIPSITVDDCRVTAYLRLLMYGEEKSTLATIDVADNFIAGQTKKYDKYFLRPVTGMSPSYRLYTAISGLNGEKYLESSLDMPYH